MLIGGLDQPPGNPGLGELNSAYLYLPNRGLPIVYHKRTLLPFGEHRPGLSLSANLERWRTTGRFVSGGKRQASEVMSFTGRGQGGDGIAAPARGV